MELQSVMTAVPQEEEEEPSWEVHPEPQEAPACDSAPRAERESHLFRSCKRVHVHDSDPQPRLTRTAKSLTEEDAIELLSEVWIWKEKNMDWKHIREATAVTSTMMLIGGKVAGPWGLAIGGAVGGLLGAWRWWRYKSVPKRLKELTSTEKKNLHRQVMAIVRALEWTDFEELTEQVMKNKAVKDKLWELTMSFVTHKMGNA